MCYYRYVYYSRCQHGEFYKQTLCDAAKALGQLQRYPCPPVSHTYTELTDSREIRLQKNPNADIVSLTPLMSTLAPLRTAGAPGPLEAQHGARMPQDDFVPRSVQHDAALDTSSYHNLNIDIPLDTSSSLSMRLTRGGTYTYRP